MLAKVYRRPRKEPRSAHGSYSVWSETYYRAFQIILKEGKLRFTLALCVF